MKNIMKTLIVLVASVSLFASANAGTLGVSGTAKATYNIQSGAIAQDKGLGITNELNFTATGELDNGNTWAYSMELDPGAEATGTAATVENDDTKLTLTTPYGTVGVFIGEGGLDVDNTASQSVYGRPSDIGGADGMVDGFGIDAYNNIQYHTPAGLLPLGMSFKAAYAPATDGDNNSGNAAGNQTAMTATYAGNDAKQYQVKMAPIDGLEIGADYMEFSRAGDAAVTTKAQKPQSGSVYATYAYDAFSVGISRTMKDVLIGAQPSSDSTVENYENLKYSIAYNVNDDLSLSYEREESDKSFVTTATADVELTSSAIQAAYTMGGMTLAISHGEHDNAAYVANSEVTQTLFAVTMAF